MNSDTGTAIEKPIVKKPETQRQIITVKDLAIKIRLGHKVTDGTFDSLYPPSIQTLSETHWTPLQTAKRAASLLAVDQTTRVLDVGSGCGKFCIIGALTTRAWFFGIEQREYLFNVSRNTAVRLGAERVSFFLGNMVNLDWSSFNAFYLFNPFYENKLKLIRIDETIPLKQEFYNTYVETVKAKLGAAKAGTRVVTYHGFGGDLPPDFQLIRKEPAGNSCLELWVK